MKRKRTRPPVIINGLSLHESARSLTIRDEYLVAAIAAGALKSYRIGNKRLILTEDLLAWVRTLPSGTQQ